MRVDLIRSRANRALNFPSGFNDRRIVFFLPVKNTIVGGAHFDACLVIGSNHLVEERTFIKKWRTDKSRFYGEKNLWKKSYRVDCSPTPKLQVSISFPPLFAIISLSLFSFRAD